MARVFLSYRRADGRYAVGWIAERLAQLDEVTELRSAFQDGNLRAGDDFPAALAAEIEECDVFVAVIGPHWLGRDGDGGNRIQDPTDWVAREVGSALVAGKRVVPVLVGGAEPLRASELSRDLQPLADRHALPFDDESDLDVLVDHVKSHLDEIDRERARIGGLAEPVRLSSYRIGWVAAAIAGLAALAAGAGGLALTRLATAGADEMFVARDDLWVASATAGLALWAGAGAMGHFFLWAHLSDLARIRWRPVIVSYASVTLLLAWLLLLFGTYPPLPGGVVREWLVLMLSLTLLAPWILTLFGAAWTVPNVQRHELGARARLIGELDRAGWIAAAVLAVSVVPSVLEEAGLHRALEDSGDKMLALGYGALFTGAIAAAVLWNRVQLRNESTALAYDLADIAPGLRRNAEHLLVTAPFAARDRWRLAWLLLPTLAGIVAATWV